MSKVSVIMSVYNGEKFLSQAIESILSQTFIDFEFIIINDGSHDGSLDIIRSYHDQRMKLISRENRGLISSLNEAISLANGQYLARMDADDVSLPERLARQVSFLDNHSEIAVCGTWAEVINEIGEKIGNYDYPPQDWIGIKKKLPWHNAFIHGSVMMQKSVVDGVGVYNHNYPHVEDYELWSRIVPLHNCVNLPEKLYRYRITTSSVTRKNNLSMRLLALKVRFLVVWRLMSAIL